MLKKLLPARIDPTHRKLGPNWEGPYIVSRIIRPDNYELQTEVGKTLCHTPIPGPTRLADPNRFQGARTYTGTLYLIFFFFKVELIPVGMVHIL